MVTGSATPLKPLVGQLAARTRDLFSLERTAQLAKLPTEAARDPVRASCRRKSQQERYSLCALALARMPEEPGRAFGTRSGDGGIGRCPQRSAPVRRRLSARRSPIFWPGGAMCAISAPTERRTRRRWPNSSISPRSRLRSAIASRPGSCGSMMHARRASIRANFEAANRDALSAYAGEQAALYARLKLAGLNDAPIQLAVFCDEATEQGHGLGARTMAETRRYSTVCALHTFWLAARTRGLGVGWVSILDPARDRRGARRSARLDLHRLSLRRLSARGASDPGARARRLAAPRGASGSAPVGDANRADAQGRQLGEPPDSMR